MATTTNYGWTTPDNTALVTDGASAIRTLGSAIDTTLYSFFNWKQIVSATYATATSSSVTTYADSGLTATITPSSTSSRILVVVIHAPQAKSNGNALNAVNTQLLRGATIIDGPHVGMVSANQLISASSAGDVYFYIDSPATVAATTYKTQFANNVAAASVTVHFNNNTSRMFLIELPK